MKLTGSEIVADMLAKEGVAYAIGIPGHGNLALVDAFRRYQDRIQIIMPRHEQAAVHMADGYYRVKGEPLAVFTSIGAGASNTAIGLATAYVDSIPLLLLIGETHTYMRGVGVLQEIERQYWSDMPRILYPTVKRAWHIDSAIQLQRAMGQAFNAMHTGRPGPALITLPMDVQADDALVRDVLQFPHLLRLHLTISDVMPETLEGLAGLVGLEDLLLQAAPIDDAGLTSVLRSMPVLRRLTLRRLSRVTNAGLAALPACPQLEVVALIEMSGITGAAVESLRGVERMRSLDVRSCGQLTTADFAQLVSLPGLAELKVGGPAVTDQVLAILAQHPALTSLSVDDAQITPACLQQLSGSPELAGRLRSLSFARCFGVTDESLTALRRFPALETLALREIMLAGSFLQFLLDDADQPLPLRTLTVTNAFFTDESLVPLPSLCPELTCLDLSGNQGVTNAALDVLRQLPSLREVKLDNTGVTQAWTPQTE